MKKSNTGFSLIEILVVVGIMGILMAVGIASYNRMNSRSQVEQAAQLLATELRTIQKMADSGDSDCPDGKKFYGYIVSRISDAEIGYTSVCEDGNSPSGTYGLINKVQTEAFSDFQFLSLGRGVDDSETIVVSKGGIFYEVRITAAGGISVEKQE